MVKGERKYPEGGSEPQTNDYNILREQRSHPNGGTAPNMSVLILRLVELDRSGCRRSMNALQVGQIWRDTEH